MKTLPAASDSCSAFTAPTFSVGRVDDKKVTLTVSVTNSIPLSDFSSRQTTKMQIQNDDTAYLPLLFGPEAIP